MSERLKKLISSHPIEEESGYVLKFPSGSSAQLPKNFLELYDPEPDSEDSQIDEASPDSGKLREWIADIGIALGKRYYVLSTVFAGSHPVVYLADENAKDLEYLQNSISKLTGEYDLPQEFKGRIFEVPEDYLEPVTRPLQS